MKQKPASDLSRPLFSLGQVFATPKALSILSLHQVSIESLLLKHITGDWGDLTDYDAHQNHFAIRAQLRIFSSYQVGQNKIYVITEADRSSTTILLAEDY